MSDACPECGEPAETDGAYACEQCDIPLCEPCSNALMQGDDSYPILYCRACAREQESLGGESGKDKVTACQESDSE